MKLGKVTQYSIIIEPTSNFGFFVKVGCGRFSFSTKEDLIEALGEYLDNPKKLEKEYNSIPREIEPAMTTPSVCGGGQSPEIA